VQYQRRTTESASFGPTLNQSVSQWVSSITMAHTTWKAI